MTLFMFTDYLCIPSFGETMNDGNLDACYRFHTKWFQLLPMTACTFLLRWAKVMFSSQYSHWHCQTAHLLCGSTMDGEVD